MSGASENSKVERLCPVCGSGRHAPFLQKGRLSVVRCAQCSMLYASPIDPELVDGRFYDREGGEYYTSPGKLSGDFDDVRFRRELALLRRHCGGGAVLDVGCGTGAFLHQLHAAFPGDYTTLGLDVSGPALAHAASIGLPVVAARFDADFRGGPFDAVTFWAVLEHVGDPLSFLRRAAALLKPGGHAFVLVPNMSSLAVRLLGSRYRYLMTEHLNYFTTETLGKLASAVPELKVLELRSTHFNPVVLWQDLWHPRNAVPAAERARLLARTNRWKASRRLGWVRRAYALTEASLGRLGLADNLSLVLRRV